jgi:AMP phosphorylase
LEYEKEGGNSSTKMKLKVKYVSLSTGGPIVAVLNEVDARKLDLYALDRVKIHRIKTDKEIVAAIDISTKGIKPGEIGLFQETIKKLDIPEGTHVEVYETERPKSLDYIRKKLDGETLTQQEIETIVDDVLENNLSETEVTYFIAGAYNRGMNLKETTDLTKAIVDRGYKIKLNKKIILDKHCAGGVPGNRTTMIMVPIIAALGFTIPKTSSRSITSAAGTADTMEVLCPVCISHERILKTIGLTNACIIWEAALNPMGVDELFIKIRHPLSIDPEGLLLASIMAKKKAVGATHVLIDLPYGEGAKTTLSKAKKLRKKFIKLGKLLGMKVKVLLTDGAQPIGNGVGPVWEAKDVLSVLQGGGPDDLRDKSVMMATTLLKMAGLKKAERKVKEVIDSGSAYQKMLEIIQAQGGSKNIKLPKPKYFHPIIAKKQGTVTKIDNKLIAKIARIAGSPKDKAAGLYLRVHVGRKVRTGKELFTIYAENKKKLDYASKLAEKHEVIRIT